MPSTLLSRFLPATAGEPSIYETLHQEDQSSDHLDLEERAGMALDEENLGEAFDDHELDDVLSGAPPSPASTSRARSVNRRTITHNARTSQSRAGTQGQRSTATLDEVDDNVPSSLLFEGNQEQGLDLRVKEHHYPGLLLPAQGPLSRDNRAKWKATQEQQPLYEDLRDRQSKSRLSLRPSMAKVDPKEQAMWRWANVQNLDNFLKDAYDYFLGNGIWSILLSRGLNLLYVFIDLSGLSIY